jgi:folate-binding Fe-S cluster repair protein YgfZ
MYRTYNDVLYFETYIQRTIYHIVFSLCLLLAPVQLKVKLSQLIIYHFFSSVKIAQNPQKTAILSLETFNGK